MALSPIPVPYATECFRQNSRGTALAVTNVLSWVSGLLVTLFFPILQNIMNQYVFLVFVAFLVIVLLTVVLKVMISKNIFLIKFEKVFTFITKLRFQRQKGKMSRT